MKNEHNGKKYAITESLVLQSCKLLYRYADLWALRDRTSVCWEIAGREFADRLSSKLNQRLTIDDVKHKVLLIKAGPKKLNKTQGTARTTLCAYLWYAHKLGLKQQLISDGGIKIGREKITPQVGVMDEADRLINEITGEMTGGQTPINVQSDNSDTSIISSNICQERPSTWARASRKYIQSEKSCIQKYKEVVDVWPDVEALREVQLHFGGVYTNQDTVYSRPADRLYGCAYIGGKAQTCKTIIFFGVRSILTAFNMLLAAIPDISTRYHGGAKFFNTILDVIEEIGLDLKAVLHHCPYDSMAIKKRCYDMLPSLKKAKVIREMVGLSPHRAVVRVEAEFLTKENGKKLKIVHNYGHGGYGVTATPGTAKYAVKLVRDLQQQTVILKYPNIK
uniref:FAD dependent oxidoreductase domain-containing protein n=1 Tax=Glossina austeni TaxID=7395 RepID=A0A1A9UVJ8_GLOAU